MTWSGAEIVHCAFGCMAFVLVVTSLGIPDWSKAKPKTGTVVEFGFYMIRVCEVNTGDCVKVKRTGDSKLESYESASLGCSIFVLFLILLDILMTFTLVVKFHHRLITFVSFSLVFICITAAIIQVASVSSYSASMPQNRIFGDGWCVAVIAIMFLIAMCVSALAVHVDFTYHIPCGLHESVQDRATNAPGAWTPQAWADENNQFIPTSGNSLSKFLRKVREKSLGIRDTEV